MGTITWLMKTIISAIIRAAVWIAIIFGGLYIAWRMAHGLYGQIIREVKYGSN